MQFLKIYTTLLFVLGFAFVPAFAQQAFSQPKGSSNHPIDVKLKHCLEEHYSTDGMVVCTNEAYTAWDAEMNKQYKQLRELLGSPGDDQLKNSQQSWLSFRDKEFELIAGMEKGLQAKSGGGGMYKFVAATQRMEVVKKRALELKVYYDYLISQNK